MKINCNCMGKFIALAKEKHPTGIEIYFPDKDLLTGILSNAIEVEEEIIAKSGKKRRKKYTVYIRHNYCPFCGTKYHEEAIPQEAPDENN